MNIVTPLANRKTLAGKISFYRDANARMTSATPSPDTGNGIDLRTTRLHLCPFTQADTAAVAALFADTEVSRYLSIGTLSAVGAQRFATEFVRQSGDELREAGYATLAVRRQEDDRFLGYCGLRPLPDRISAAEVVFALAPPHWRQGYAREAVKAVLAWAGTIAGLREVLAMARPEHIRSRHVMAAAGMHHVGETTRYYGETLSLYRLELKKR